MSSERGGKRYHIAGEDAIAERIFSMLEDGSNLGGVVVGEHDVIWIERTGCPPIQFLYQLSVVGECSDC
ncbi:hypothetical protein HKX41_11635 [Salinisphaera sp. USBA-960]|nr:hypothetical protein [Salifodinibacter halophilus]